MQDEQASGNTDAQWNFTPNIDDPNVIRVGFDGTTRVINSVRTRAEMLVGDVVCKFGKTTGYDCGTINYKTSDGCVSNGTSTYIYVNNNGGDMAESGDSGAPVFKNNRAWGLLSCANPESDDDGDMTFMAQNFLENIGVAVNTS